MTVQIGPFYGSDEGYLVELAIKALMARYEFTAGQARLFLNLSADEHRQSIGEIAAKILVEDN